MKKQSVLFNTFFIFDDDLVVLNPHQHYISKL